MKNIYKKIYIEDFIYFVVLFTRVGK
jgi:hypothetical protein